MNTKAPPRDMPERSATDESLRVERDRTDQAVAEALVHVDDEANAVLLHAREVAKEVLETARHKADDNAEGQGGVPTHDVKRVDEAREVEDAILLAERAAAEERVRIEREDRALLAALLPLEREKTDRFLLTERGRADEALAHRDDFLGMVSHDLRNLLAGIALNAQLLATQASESEEGRRTVAATKSIRRYIARMNRLVGDLVDVASIDAGHLAIQPAKTDATALVLEAIDAFVPVAAEKGLALSGAAMERPLLAELDHDRVFQVLANLITNAIKFTPTGGAIAVGVRRDDDYLHFFVQDTGQGIPPQVLDDVFERFWKLGKNDKRGLGLGLHISKCIVVAHGGSIWVESTVQHGSTFHFTIPTSGPRQPV